MWYPEWCGTDFFASATEILTFFLLSLCTLHSVGHSRVSIQYGFGFFSNKQATYINTATITFFSFFLLLYFGLEKNAEWKRVLKNVELFCAKWTNETLFVCNRKIVELGNRWVACDKDLMLQDVAAFIAWIILHLVNKRLDDSNGN